MEVSIGDFFFNPQFSSLPEGGTVCWRNDGQVAHTVTSDEGIFLSGPIAPGTVYLLTFSLHNRTYYYHCDFHPAMTGALIVGNQPPPPPPPPTISPEFAVSDTPSAQQLEPRVAFDGTNYLATWQEGSEALLGGRVDQFGDHLDGPGNSIASGTSRQLAFDGTNYFVVWMKFNNDWTIRGARVSTEGALLDPNGIFLTGGPWWLVTVNPDVAFNGTSYLVVSHQHDDINNYWITGLLVSPSGVRGQSAYIYLGLNARPRVSAGNTTSLVVWDGADGISARLVGDDGTPLGSSFMLADGGDTPEVAFDGTNYLVTWSDGGNILGRRVAEDGTVLDPTTIPVSTASGSQITPDAAFDGTNFVVTWQDTRSGDTDIYGARVDPDGNVLDSDGFPIASSVSDESTPATTAGSIGRVAVSYERATQAFLRFVDDGVLPPPPPPPPPSTTAASTTAAAATTTTTTAATATASRSSSPASTASATSSTSSWSVAEFREWSGYDSPARK